MKTDKNYKKGEMITVDITDFGENGEGHRKKPNPPPLL